MGIEERKQRERNARVRLILQAGLATFAKYGYHGTSMDLIAGEAELGKATLYYYFKSKNELLLGILKNGLISFFTRLEEAWQEVDSPIEKLEIVTDIGADFFRENPDYFKLYNYMASHPSLRERGFRELHEVVVEKFSKIRDIFAVALRRGLIKPQPLDSLVEIFGSMVMGMGMLSGAHPSPEQLKEKARLIREVFLNGILKKE
ncbi:hypothetical protein B1H10_07930 [candidate division KSB1 bacterium 4484_188]|nr:MAG: hypothetical protein B1H10_07930 [candidate division KSB1 bacterium 4484_188]HFE64891.1 TetR/AcrR family transcriptional regulator [Caldithrix sp.]